MTMTDQPTPTPRTDAQVRKENPIGETGNTAVISTDFARELERELAAAKQSDAESIAMYHRARDRADAERALADRLAETLANVQGDYASTGGITTPEVDEALAAWKEARNAP